jgi:hypothetical protein
MMNTAKIKLASFELQPDENVLYQTLGHRPWYAIGWKVFSGVITIVLLTVIFWFIFSGPVTGSLSTILPTTLASVLTRILCFGLIPVLVTIWVAEDVARTFTGKFVLTDKRLWAIRRECHRDAAQRYRFINLSPRCNFHPQKIHPEAHRAYASGWKTS